jgi:uncharacterized protein YrrD
MNIKTLATAMIALGAMTTAGMAQTQGGTAAMVEVENDATMVPQFNMNVDQFEELDIVTADGERLGDVEEVLADTSGKVVAVVAEFGGFLGVGEKEVILMLDQVELQNDALVTPLTKDELKTLPEWKD